MELRKLMAAVLCIAIIELSAGTRAEGLPNGHPIFRIEAEMHTAPIRAVAISTDHQLMATASDDKTVRVWSLPNGRLIRVLRPPIGPGDEGKVYAVAIDPKGHWIAAAGWNSEVNQERSSYSVYIFSVANGEVLRRLRSLPARVTRLAVSQDGRFLAAGLKGVDGIRIWETASWRVSAEDADYDGDVYGLSFNKKGRLAATSLDGDVRIYSSTGDRLFRGAMPGGKRPIGVSYSPDGKHVAVGYEDSTSIEVLDGDAFVYEYSVDTTKIDGGNLGHVAWLEAGQIAATGRFSMEGVYPIVVWNKNGNKGPIFWPGARDAVLDLAPYDQGLAFGAGSPAMGVLDAVGERVIFRDPPKADMRGKREWYFLVSRDGGRVRFGLKVWDEDPYLFNVEDLRFDASPIAPIDMLQPDTTSLKIGEWIDSNEPKLNHKYLALERHEISRSLAIFPDFGGFVLGAEWSLRRFDAAGNQIWQKSVPGITWGVNTARSGRLIIAAYGDGTIRWHRASDGEELLALFVSVPEDPKADKEWVLWTPKGYYAASVKGESLIGWHVNRGPDQAADFYPAGQFRDQYYRPDIVKLVLDRLDEGQAIEEANALAKRREAEEIRKRQPPVIAIVQPETGSSFSETEMAVRYSVRSPSGLPVTAVRALIDGRPTESAGSKGFVPVAVDAATQGELRLRLPPQNLTLSLIAEAGDSISTPAEIRLTYAGPPPLTAEDISKPVLYALVVGVSDYQNAGITKLRWADNDARAVANHLQRQKGKLYRDVQIKLLVNKDAHHDAVLDGLEWLTRVVSQGDVGVVFLSGHGATNPSYDYYFLPYDAELESETGLFLPKRRTAVPDSEILHALKSLHGHALFFFDTCHAGRASGIRLKGDLDLRRFVNELRSAQNGVVVLASSDGSQLSQENDEWQHGAFTKAMSEGLDGKADLVGNDGIIHVDELGLYIKDRVKELTNGLQHPVETRPQETRNIPFAWVKR